MLLTLSVANFFVLPNHSNICIAIAIIQTLSTAFCHRRHHAKPTKKKSLEKNLPEACDWGFEPVTPCPAARLVKRLGHKGLHPPAY